MTAKSSSDVVEKSDLCGVKQAIRMEPINVRPLTMT